MMEQVDCFFETMQNHNLHEIEEALTKQTPTTEDHTSDIKIKQKFIRSAYECFKISKRDKQSVQNDARNDIPDKKRATIDEVRV